MDRLLQDLRFALRSVARRPAAALIPVLTLALGIGASTAVFSVFDAVLLEPPPYHEPDRLVLLWHRTLATGGERVRVPGPDVVLYHRDTDVFEGLAFVAGADDLAMEGDGPMHVRVGVATPNLFRVLGVEAAVGRTFRPGEGLATGGEEGRGGPAPVLLDHELWSGRFGADREAIGRIVRIGGVPMRVIGVLPPDFDLLLPPGTGMPEEIQAWRPLATPLRDFRRPEGLRDQDSDNTGAVIGRLRPDASLPRARQAVDLVSARLREVIPHYEEGAIRAEVVPLHEDATRHARPLLLALLGAVALVLLIACANVANLLLARAVDRSGEMAVRSALGAGRGRLARQVFTEAAVLGLWGAGLGVLLALWGVELLVGTAPEGMVGLEAVRIDASVLAFAVAAGLAATLLFGSVPAAAISGDVARAVGAAGPRPGGPPRRKLRRGLVIWEVALSFTLLVGAVLMLETMNNLRRVELGFEPEGLLTLQAALPPGAGGPAERARRMDAFERDVRNLPGVESVGIVGGLPLGEVLFRQPYGIDGTDPEDWSDRRANFRVITAEYFRAMGTRLIAGRTFTPSENVSEDRRVAIVDQKLARKIAPGGRAVGRRIGFPLDGDPIWATIVGVVEDVRFSGLRDPGYETIYVPYRQEASRTVAVAVRARGEPSSLIPAIRDIARRQNAALPMPVYGFRDMEAYVSRALGPARFARRLLTIFATLAVVLAVVGVYGVISYAVGRRAREFGIRRALGAPTARLLSGVLLGGLSLSLAGVVLGAGLAFIGAYSAGELFYDVDYFEPRVYALVAAALLLATVAACWVPARRAASVEPLDVLERS